MKPFKASAAYAADLQAAYDYFKQGGQLAAERFLARYTRVRRVISENPLACRPRSNGWRQMLVPGSTYAIFYREAPDFWFLGGVVSIVQDPDAIQARLLLREISDSPPPSE
jgi:plasmid stabilization system protein ParE